MTFKEAMIKEMTSRGMFDSQAETVINKYIEENKNPEMNDKWFDNVSSFPQGLSLIVWMGLKEYVADWILINAPQAWFRPMFQYSDAQLTQMMNKQ